MGPNESCTKRHLKNLHLYTCEEMRVVTSGLGGEFIYLIEV